MASSFDRTGYVLLVAATVAAAAGVVGISQERERESRAEVAALTGGDPERGVALLRAYGCTGCHVIPGAGRGLAGPPLTRMAERLYVGGVLVNTPANLVAWIVDPPAHDPSTAMPVTGISEAEARDVAAYLYLSR